MNGKSIMRGVGALAALALASPALAQEGGEATALERILVTAGLTPVEQEKSGRAYTVITGEELERNQIRHVSEALRKVPGFTVSRAGGAGGLTQLRVRGAEANHVLVLVDGVDVSETSAGEFDFGSLLVDDIDRIEILRGPQSAFWGSNATAGVVNIITRRGTRDGLSVRWRAEMGSDATRIGGLSVTAGGENWDLALSGIHHQTDGFNISDFGNEADGDENRTINGKLVADLAPGVTWDATFRNVNRRSETDNQDFDFFSPTYGLVLDTDDLTNTRETFGSSGLTVVSPDGAWTQVARFTSGDTFRDYQSGGVVVATSEGARRNAGYRISHAFETAGARHTLTGGFEYEYENFHPDHVTQTFERDTRSWIGEYRGEFMEQFFFNAAVRRDDNDAFADATTWTAAAAWKIPGTATRLHASVGTGVTNPTFYEQFGFIPNNFVGNPGLKPESSFGWDVGIEQGFLDGGLVVDVTYFNQNLTDEIVIDFSNFPISTPFNAGGESTRQGVEVAARIDFFNGFTMDASYTWVDAMQQLVAGGAKTRELRRPQHQGAVTAAYAFPDERTRIFAEAIFNGDMLDVAFVPGVASPTTLDNYTIVNLGGSYKLSDSLEAYGRVENVFDTEYEELFAYNSQGRTAFVGLRGKF